MLMSVFLQRSLSFNLWVDMVWHNDLHSRRYSILSFTYHASSHTAIVLLLFTVLPLILLRGWRFPVLGITNEKAA